LRFGLGAFRFTARQLVFAPRFAALLAIVAIGASSATATTPTPAACSIARPRLFCGGRCFLAPGGDFRSCVGSEFLASGQELGWLPGCCRGSCRFGGCRAFTVQVNAATLSMYFPDFFRVFIVEHNFRRYLTPEFQHIQPFWFYIPITLLAIFPWTILLIPLSKQVLETIRGRRPELDSTFFFLSWVAFPFVFFSVSQSKLPGYILPAIPPLVLLLAASLSARLRSSEKAASWLVPALGAGLIALAIALSAFSGKLPGYTDLSPPPEVSLIEFIAAFAGATVIVLALLRRVHIALFAMVLFVLLLVLKTDDLVGKLDRGLTARSAPSAASQQWPQFSPSLAAAWGLTRSQVYQLNFYTHSILPEWQPRDSKPTWLFIGPKELRQAEAFGFECRKYPVNPAVIPCRTNP